MHSSPLQPKTWIRTFLPVPSALIPGEAAIAVPIKNYLFWHILWDSWMQDPSAFKPRQYEGLSFGWCLKSWSTRCAVQIMFSSETICKLGVHFWSAVLWRWWRLWQGFVSTFWYRYFLTHSMCRCVCCLLFRGDVVSNSEIPWTVAHHAPLSMGFHKQDYWSGLPLPSPGDLPDPGRYTGSFLDFS